MYGRKFPSPASIDGFQQIAGSCSVLEQVSLYTGNLFCRYSIVNISTERLPLLFDLIYNSQGASVGPVGAQWRHNYMMELELNNASSPTQITFVSETDRPFTYSWDGSNWTPLGSSLFFPGALTKSGSNYLITMPGGDVMTFELNGGTFSVSGSLTSGNSTVSAVSAADLNRLNVGDAVTHASLPSGSVITAISSTGFTVSNNATASASGASIGVTVSATLYRLKSIADVHGFAVALTYNTAGQLTTITDPSGNRTIALGYNTSALVSSITDPNGQAASPSYSTLLSYDSDLNLTTVVGPELCITTYGYETPSNHLLTSREDHLCHTVTFGYTQNSDSSSPLYTLQQLTSVTDPDSNQIHYAYDRINENIGHLELQSFNRTRLHV